MAVTRVGLVGLTSIKPDGLGPHAWAVFALLPVFLHSPDYELVALCNSSLESARRAIEAYGLPSSVKAYGNPEDLAKDPDVDLVVISVRVGKHFEIAKPALLEGKKTVVGVQARADPLVLKVREIIQSGKLGRITSAHALGSTSSLPSHFWFNGMDYYQDIKSGGNLYHINFAHFLDSFTYVLGDFETLQSDLKTEITEIPVMRDDGTLTEPRKKNTPDHVLVQGRLKSGAVASIVYRWCDLQEAVVANEPPKRKLKLKLRGKPEEDVDFPVADAEFVRNMENFGQNSGRILNAFAQGDQAVYADFSSATQTHKLLDEILKKSGHKS
uniref:Gfo/Idh/MocA-like oxidoreductase N-terminal domain-containing protein n=1 Tax=Bionectria ochroleuca TaxID=29856 RepID=A0A8H7KEV3_BIOOC